MQIVQLKKLWEKYKFDEKVKNIEDRLWGNIVIKIIFTLFMSLVQ